jgi:hypothetical protein
VPANSLLAHGNRCAIDDPETSDKKSDASSRDEFASTTSLCSHATERQLVGIFYTIPVEKRETGNSNKKSNKIVLRASCWIFLQTYSDLKPMMEPRR